MFGFKKISAKLDDVLSKISLCRIEIEAVSSKLKELEKICAESVELSKSVLFLSHKIVDERQKVFFEKRYIIKFGENIKCSPNLTMPDNGNAFKLIGPGSIKTIFSNGVSIGEGVILFFDSNGIVHNNIHGDGSRIILSKGEAFYFSPGNTLSIIFDGDKWIEVARS